MTVPTVIAGLVKQTRTTVEQPPSTGQRASCRFSTISMNKTVLCREWVSENLLNRVVYRAAECCTLAPTCVSFFECSAQRAWKSTQGFASSVFFGGVFITRYVPVAACLLAMLANKEVPR